MAGDKDSQQVLDRLAGRLITIEGNFICKSCGHRERLTIMATNIPDKWETKCSWCQKFGRVQIIDDELREYFPAHYNKGRLK